MSNPNPDRDTGDDILGWLVELEFPYHHDPVPDRATVECYRTTEAKLGQKMMMIFGHQLRNNPERYFDDSKG